MKLLSSLINSLKVKISLGGGNWQERERKKMEENCEDCMQWEEELYWTHFQTLHFSQLLLTGFHHRLVIPQKFSKHCKRKLPQVVTLKSPSGAIYNVRLEQDDVEKTLAFRTGWDKFVKDHLLKENDLLVFKFHGVSEFEVLIFDGQTLCERPASYFVRKCGHADKTKGTDFTATSSRSPEIHFNPVDVETSPNQQRLISPPVVDINELEDLIDIDVEIDTMLTPRLVVSQTGYDQEEHFNSDIDTASAQLPVISPTSTGRVSKEKYPFSGLKKMRGEISNDSLDHKPAGRNKALSLAQRVVLPDGFMVVMKRSHVSKCFLTIPYKWCLKNNLLARQEVVMQVDQKKWVMKFNFSDHVVVVGYQPGGRSLYKTTTCGRVMSVCLSQQILKQNRFISMSIFFVLQKRKVATMVDSICKKSKPGRQQMFVFFNR